MLSISADREQEDGWDRSIVIPLKTVCKVTPSHYARQTNKVTSVMRLEGPATIVKGSK